MSRARGWVTALGGLAAVACSLLIADLRTALSTSATLIVLSGCAPVVIWAAYRFGGGHTGVAPPA